MMIPETHNKKIVLGVSGASGAIYVRRLLDVLVEAGCQVHVVFTNMARRIMKAEQDIDYAQLKGQISSHNVLWYDNDDMFSQLASGSFLTDGMVICPCSSNCMAAIAAGLADTLLLRSAYISLKQHNGLILVHREMPLSVIDTENMLRISRAGGIICPASPGFYMNPKTIEDIVDMVIARVLDLLNVEHKLAVRWTEQYNKS